MSRPLVLPLPQPPERDERELAELRRLLDYARAHLAAARHRLARMEHITGYSAPASLLCTVYVDVRQYEVDRWAREVKQLERWLAEA